jgi:hypothetical protein
MVFSRAAIAKSAVRTVAKSQPVPFSANLFASRESRVCLATEAREPYKSEVGHTTAQDLKPPSCKLKNSESTQKLSATKHSTGWSFASKGLGARCIMIGGLTAGQFAIFDSMLPAIGIDKFHYHEPAAAH